MALTYTLYIKCKKSSEEGVSTFLKQKNIPYTTETIGHTICINVHESLGFILYFFSKDKSHFDYIAKKNREEYEWNTCSCISFDLNKFFNNTQAKLNLIDITASVLKNTTKDAVLLFNSDSLILNRKDGILTLNSDNDFWKQEEPVLKIETEVP